MGVRSPVRPRRHDARHAGEALGSLLTERPPPTLLSRRIPHTGHTVCGIFLANMGGEKKSDWISFSSLDGRKETKEDQGLYRGRDGLAGFWIVSQPRAAAASVAQGEGHEVGQPQGEDLRRGFGEGVTVAGAVEVAKGIVVAALELEIADGRAQLYARPAAEPPRETPLDGHRVLVVRLVRRGAVGLSSFNVLLYI